MANIPVDDVLFITPEFQSFVQQLSKRCAKNIECPPKKKSARVAKELPSEFDYQLAGKWAGHSVKIVPTISPNLEKWADAVRQLRTLDHLSEDELEAIFAFVCVDDFWKTAALSPAAIRTRSKNGLKKYQNIQARMQTEGFASDKKDWTDFMTAEEKVRHGIP